MKDPFGTQKPVHFIFPIDGDCLNSADGTVQDGKLILRVLCAADPDADLYINEEKAVWNGDCFEADVILLGRHNTLFAEDRSCPEHCDRIAVYDFRHSEGKYRISSDDNILFLKDLTEHRYASIFENPYLAVYKEAHDRFGAKVHLNLFYAYDYADHGTERFGIDRGYFDLSMMTDRYRDEWEASADWLRLAFHARSEFPDRPYQNTTMKRIAEDAERVNTEIRRFAGEKSLAKVLTLHWGESPVGGLRVLRSLGYRGAAGYFEFNPDGSPLVAYHYPRDLVAHVGSRDFWMNTEEDMMHARIDLVLNTVPYEDLIPRLEAIRADAHRSGFLELMIHEQYFYEDYCIHLPKFRSLVLDSAAWAYEHGYRGALLDEVMFED